MRKRILRYSGPVAAAVVAVALVGAPRGVVAAQDFAARWMVDDGESVRQAGRVARHGDRLRLDIDADPPASAAAWIGELATGEAWRLDARDRVVGRGRMPAALTQAWPIRQPVAIRCQDPAWRCEQIDRVAGADGALTVWRLAQFEAGGWRQSLVWQDEATATIVREQWPQGRSVQLLSQSTARHEGREVQVQHYLTTRADGTRWHSRYWYDPQIDQVVREDSPDGSSRWLEGIEVGPQPEARFPLPPVAGFPAPVQPASPGSTAETGAVELPPPPGSYRIR